MTAVIVIGTSGLSFYDSRLKLTGGTGVNIPDEEYIPANESSFLRRRCARNDDNDPYDPRALEITRVGMTKKKKKSDFEIKLKGIYYIYI